MQYEMQMKEFFERVEIRSEKNTNEIVKQYEEEKDEDNGKYKIDMKQNQNESLS